MTHIYAHISICEKEEGRKKREGEREQLGLFDPFFALTVF